MKITINETVNSFQWKIEEAYDGGRMECYRTLASGTVLFNGDKQRALNQAMIQIQSAYITAVPQPVSPNGGGSW